MIEALKAEKALARLHGIKPENEQAFHARIGNLKKLGAVPSASRGKRLSYTLADIEILAFCTALAEYRLDPSIIRDFVMLMETKFLRHLSRRGRKSERTAVRRKRRRFILRLPQGSWRTSWTRAPATILRRAGFKFTRRTSLEKLSIAENCIFGSVAASV